ncbi:G5 and 3D domain-containing protein [Metabacillus fastidiosus]|uniref:Ubiquitin-like domain-containing protein n=1 Tax=Metabacillus fastidiosus TaxID=1458 RepID=A0ABU6P5H5_9BACI|nr:G5 and 3D domain-containing protein [Metabacillus fastidiosus]MED4404178.1 ubiquitin-like domain-containing protein [Metabacillus fastidiosus]MED4455587.1 ubiquitin-like domain-containing protein [Metabacillus fastidiosus]MED4464729.1 ubiquitin-like domain-containing protein [Metabacillus fastidiosus]
MKKLFSKKLLKNKYVLTAAGVLFIGSGTAYGTYEGTKDTVKLSLNGEQQSIRTHADTVNDVLEEYEVDIRKEDHISPSPSSKIKNQMEIEYEASIPVEITLDNERRTIWTTAETVKDLIEEEKIAIAEHDKVSSSLDTKIKKNMAINIEKAISLTLNVGGEQQQVWTTSTTVADFLKEKNVKLNDLDKIEPALTEKLNGKDVITVTRVEKVTDVVEEPIAFNTVTKKDHNISKGKEKVIDPGEKGKQEKHYEVIIENGKEVSRKLIKMEKLKDSKDRVVAQGTKVEQQATQVSRGGTSSGGKEMYVTATAYTASCNGCSGTTRTGLNLRANPNAKVIAVDPSVIPLGSKVHVEGYGYAIASDTGGAIKGNKIDVFVPDTATAYRWGNKRVKIKIIN